MDKPTLEQYEKAKNDFGNYCDWARISRHKQGELIDALADERRSELFYHEQADKCREIIVAYEVYEKAEKGGV